MVYTMCMASQSTRLNFIALFIYFTLAHIQLLSMKQKMGENEALCIESYFVAKTQWKRFTVTLKTPHRHKAKYCQSMTLNGNK